MKNDRNIFKQSILIIDDEIQNMYLVLAAFSLNNYLVYPTDDPIRAMNILRNKSVDFVFLDFKFSKSSDRYTGVDIIRELFHINRRINIVFLTNYGEELRSQLPSDLAEIPILKKENYGEVYPQLPAGISGFLNTPISLETSGKQIGDLQTEIESKIQGKGWKKLLPRWSLLNYPITSYGVKLAGLLPLSIILLSYAFNIPFLGQNTIGYLWITATCALLCLLGTLLNHFMVPRIVSSYRDAHQYYLSEIESFDQTDAGETISASRAGGELIDLIENSTFLKMYATYNLKDRSKNKSRVLVAGLYLGGILAFGISLVARLYFSVFP